MKGLLMLAGACLVGCAGVGQVGSANTVMTISIAADFSSDQKDEIVRGAEDWTREIGVKFEFSDKGATVRVVKRSSVSEAECPFRNETDEVLPFGSISNQNGVDTICIPDMNPFYERITQAVRRNFEHELGHHFGLHHEGAPDDNGTMMSPTFATNSFFLTQTDINQYEQIVRGEAK